MSGRRRFKGTLTAVSDGDDDSIAFTIEVDGTTYELRVADVEWAQLVPDWDAVLRGGGAERAELPGTSRGYRG